MPFESIMSDRYTHFFNVMLKVIWIEIQRDRVLVAIIALQKIKISTNFLLILIHLRCGGDLKQNLSDDEKIDENNPKILKCKIDIESV